MGGRKLSFDDRSNSFAREAAVQDLAESPSKGDHPEWTTPTHEATREKTRITETGDTPGLEAYVSPAPPGSDFPPLPNTEVRAPIVADGKTPYADAVKTPRTAVVDEQGESSVVVAAPEEETIGASGSASSLRCSVATATSLNSLAPTCRASDPWLSMRLWLRQHAVSFGCGAA